MRRRGGGCSTRRWRGVLPCSERQRDISAFPLPSLLDRVLIGIGAQIWSSADGELLIRAMELSNRNGRYAVSDALSVMAAQQSEDERRAAQAVLRLTDRQEAWEVGQIAQVVKRVADRQPDPKSFAAQFTARDFDHALQRLQKGMRPANTKLPSLAEKKKKKNCRARWAWVKPSSALCPASAFASPPRACGARRYSRLPRETA